MFDANLLFTNNLAISATGNSSILDISKWPAQGAWVELTVTGAITGTTPTLDAKVQYSDSGTFASGISDGPDFNQIIPATANKRQALLCQSKKKFARIAYTVGGTTPVFNGVTAGVVSGPNRDDTA